MTLKAVIDSLEAAPEAMRSFYKESGDKFVLNVEPVGGFALEDVTGLRTALASERTLHQTAAGSLKAFDGIDPAKAREAMEKVAKFGNLDPNADADKIVQEKLSLAKEQLQSEYLTKEEALTTLNSGLQTQLSDLLFDNAVMQSVSDHQGNIALFKPVIAQRVKVDVADGKVVMHVVGDDGQPKVKDHVNNTPYSISDLVADLKADENYAGAFSAGGGGSGKPPLSVGKPDAQKPDQHGTSAQRAAHYAKKHGLPVR